jgi:hypothetical protein
MSVAQQHRHGHGAMIGRCAASVAGTRHDATVDHPQQVLGPADDAVTFFQPRAMVFVTMLWVAAVVWAVCRGLYVLILLAFGIRPTAADIVTVAESLLVVPVVIAGAGLLTAWNRLGRLHSSVHGLEFAATGRRAVRLPWSSIASAALRHRGVFTELVVTPASPDAVTELPGPGRRPRRSGASFIVDVGLMSPGPQALLAELHRRIPSKV